MKILVLKGDGIGPEIVDAALTVLESAARRYSLEIELTERVIGLDALQRFGTTLPEGVLAEAARSDGVILGPISHAIYPPKDQGGINVSAEFRVALDLYANIRPNRTRKVLKNRFGEMDLIIVRECTEGFYADRNMFAGSGEFMPTEDMALSIRKITAHGSNRIARVAFELAAARRRKVTAVHKANVLRVTESLFLREVRKVAREYPDVELEEVLVDAMAALLVRDASRFDVIVTTNLYGDILSDEAAELSGSLGLGGSLNAGRNLAVAQAQHGSAPDIAGQDKANPVSMILSVAMLLEWIGKRHGLVNYVEAAEAIDKAVDEALYDPEVRTPDLGGSGGTRSFAARAAEALDDFRREDQE